MSAFGNDDDDDFGDFVSAEVTPAIAPAPAVQHSVMQQAILIVQPSAQAAPPVAAKSPIDVDSMLKNAFQDFSTDLKNDWGNIKGSLTASSATIVPTVSSSSSTSAISDPSPDSASSAGSSTKSTTSSQSNGSNSSLWNPSRPRKPKRAVRFNEDVMVQLYYKDQPKHSEDDFRSMDDDFAMSDGGFADDAFFGKIQSPSSSRKPGFSMPVMPAIPPRKAMPKAGPAVNIGSPPGSPPKPMTVAPIFSAPPPLSLSQSTPSAEQMILPPALAPSAQFTPTVISSSPGAAVSTTQPTVSTSTPLPSSSTAAAVTTEDDEWGDFQSEDVGSTVSSSILPVHIEEGPISASVTAVQENSLLTALDYAPDYAGTGIMTNDGNPPSQTSQSTPRNVLPLPTDTLVAAKQPLSVDDLFGGLQPSQSTVPVQPLFGDSLLMDFTPAPILSADVPVELTAPSHGNFSDQSSTVEVSSFMNAGYADPAVGAPTATGGEADDFISATEFDDFVGPATDVAGDDQWPAFSDPVQDVQAPTIQLTVPSAPLSASELFKGVDLQSASVAITQSPELLMQDFDFPPVSSSVVETNNVSLSLVVAPEADVPIALSHDDCSHVEVDDFVEASPAYDSASPVGTALLDDSWAAFPDEQEQATVDSLGTLPHAPIPVVSVSYASAAAPPPGGDFDKPGLSVDDLFSGFAQPSLASSGHSQPTALIMPSHSSAGSSSTEAVAQLPNAVPETYFVGSTSSPAAERAHSHLLINNSSSPEADLTARLRSLHRYWDALRVQRHFEALVRIPELMEEYNSLKNADLLEEAIVVKRCLKDMQASLLNESDMESLKSLKLPQRLGDAICQLAQYGEAAAVSSILSPIVAQLSEFIVLLSTFQSSVDVKLVLQIPKVAALVALVGRLKDVRVCHDMLKDVSAAIVKLTL